MRKVTYRPTEPYSLYEMVSALNANDLALSYTGSEGTTETFATEDQVKDILARFYDRLVLLDGDHELTTAEKRTEFLKLYNAWWSRRKTEWGRLLDAINKEYNPLWNYDRHEEGSIITNHDIGARSGTDNLTDNYAATQHTKTETPRVVDTIQDTYGATQETVTETPRAEMTTTTTPGVVTTTENGVFGDNSGTEVPQSKTVVTPDATNPDVVKVAGTDGTNTTVTADLMHTDSRTESHDGQNTTVDADLARIDTHNRTTGSQAAKDTDTQTYDDYHVFGNIGVTTSAQMLQGELELRSALDLITHAVVEFVNLVSVYC